MNFVDFEKAFGSIHRDTLWKLLKFYGIPECFVNIIKNIYENYHIRVIHAGHQSHAFEVKSGVRQGCILSPTIFLIVIDYIMHKLSNEKGIKWNLNERLTDLCFADDLCLMSCTVQDMQTNTNILNQEAKKFGLNINQKKTKIMNINPNQTNNIYLDNKIIEEVNSFTYLGCIISIEGGTNEDILNRLNKARISFSILNKFRKNKNISLSTKIRIFNTNVKSILLYGAETWHGNKTNMKKLQIFINKCLRKILKIRCFHKETNAEILKTCNQKPIEYGMRKRKWRWIGHVLRKPEKFKVKETLEWNP